MTKVISVKDIDEFNNKAADVIKESIKWLLHKQETVVFGISGGRSVAGVFNKLGEKEIKWKNVHIFMVDERIVPINNCESNFKVAKENFIEDLIDKKLLPEKNIHPFIIEKGLGSYADELKRYGGVYDVVLLSSGEDDHIAGLFPNHHSVKDNSGFFIKMGDSPKLPKDRMSASTNLLKKAKVAILLFLGGKKKESFKRFIDKKNTVTECPAKIIFGIKDSYAITCFND